MTDEECIATALLHGATIRRWGRHGSRPHDVYYLRDATVDPEHPAEKKQYLETRGSDYPRFYFISVAEAARKYCEYHNILLPDEVSDEVADHGS